MPVTILTKPISKAELTEIAKPWYGNLIKLAVDITKEKIALGGEWHADCQKLLMENSSDMKNIWGANLFLTKDKVKRLEFVALINIKPNFNHFTMGLEDAAIQEKIQNIVDKFIA